MYKEVRRVMEGKTVYRDMVHGGDRGMVEGNASDDKAEGGKVKRQGEIVYIERD